MKALQVLRPSATVFAIGLALFLLTAPVCYGEPDTTTTLRHIYDDYAGSDFSRLRGRPWKTASDTWDSLVCVPDAESCWVDWSGTYPRLVISDKGFSTFKDAHVEFLNWIQLVQLAFPNLSPIYPPEDHRDDHRTFFNASTIDENKNAHGPSVEVSIQTSDSGRQDVFISFESESTSAAAKETALQVDQSMSQYVRDDVNLYITDAQTNFRSPEAKLRHPLAAEHCEVKAINNVGFAACVFRTSPYRNELLGQANDLVRYVRQALPPTWSQDPKPPLPKAIMSVGYSSRTGETGNIWVDKSSDGNYELDYMVFAAPKR